MHVVSFETCLKRARMHSPNHTPNDRLPWRHIHDTAVQLGRRAQPVTCEPPPGRVKGVVHDYVPFYFGVFSPMLLRLKTGRVEGYDEGQEPLVYVRSTAQRIADSGTDYVFSDAHGLASFTHWYDDLKYLDKVDWGVVGLRYWQDTVDDPDRQRRKQAEFMVHRGCDLGLVEEIGVHGDSMKRRVEGLLQSHRPELAIPVSDRRHDWYYP